MDISGMLTKTPISPNILVYILVYGGFIRVLEVMYSSDSDCFIIFKYLLLN